MISDEVKKLILDNVLLWLDDGLASHQVLDKIDEYLQHQGNDFDTYMEELRYADNLVRDNVFRLQEKHNFRSQLKTRSKSPFMRSFKTGRVKCF